MFNIINIRMSGIPFSSLISLLLIEAYFLEEKVMGKSLGELYFLRMCRRYRKSKQIHVINLEENTNNINDENQVSSGTNTLLPLPFLIIPKVKVYYWHHGYILGNIHAGGRTN